MTDREDVVLRARIETDAGATAVVTLHRPEARNALTRGVITQLRAALADADADDSVGAVVLTGSDPAFSAGVDLKALGSEGGWDDISVAGPPTGYPWVPLRKPVIGAINGATVTGGLELALACDFLIASDRARFADTHARVGVMPGWGLTVLLPQRIGVARAREMSVTGNFIDAQQAYEWGLVNHVVPHDELLPFCRKLAADSITIDQRAVRRMLATYTEVTDTTIGQGWEVEDRVSREWEGSGFDPAEIEARRLGIVERGRSQIGKD